jgi:hypothetical protein
MASSYTDLLRLTLPATGELAGQWGNTVNTGITELTEAAIAGTAAVTLADANHTLTVANGVTDQARRMFVTLTGTLTAQREVVCPSSSKLYFVSNNTTGGFGILFKMATGTGIVVPAGKGMVLYCNGTNVVDAVSHMSSLTVAGDAVVNGKVVGRGGSNVSSNTAFGSSALLANTSGAGNTALGSATLLSNTTGLGNVAVGGTALRTNVSGNYNTATGVDALRLNASGSYSVAVGSEAAYNSTAGSNTAIGYQALRANTTGSNNIAIGVAAGSILTTGSNNTIVGNLSGTAGMAGTILIGAGGTERIRVTSAGNTLLGTTTDDGVNKLQVNGSVSATGVTLTDGTANGVPYLNASKVLTSGSALTFDGTNLGVGTTSPGFRLDSQVSSVATNDQQVALRLKATTTANMVDGFGVNTLYSIQDSSGVNFNIGQMRVIRDGQDDSGAFVFAPYLAGTASERMRLSAAGGLSIGTTTNPGTGGLYVAGNTTLGDATTDTVTVNGYMGVGGAPTASTVFRVVGSSTTGTSQVGIGSFPVVTSEATTASYGMYAAINGQAGAYTTTAAYTFRAGTALKGAGATITNAYGVYIDDQTQGTNNYGITSLVSAGTNKWNIYASGTAANYFAGNVGIGTSSPANKLTVFSGTNNSDVARFTGGQISKGLLVSTYASNGNDGGVKFTSSDAVSFFIGVNEYLRIANNGALTLGSASALTLDSSGNLGLGVVPGAWGAVYKAIQINSSAAFVGTNLASDALMLSNTRNTDSDSRYINTGAAAYYRQFSGSHTWFTAPSGTAGAAVTFTQAMTLTAAGNLGIGTTSPAVRLHVTSGVNSNGALRVSATSSTAGSFASMDFATGTGTWSVGQEGNGKFFIYDGSADRLVFSGGGANSSTTLSARGTGSFVVNTNGSERLRVTVGGNLIQTVNTTAATLDTNGTLTFSIVDNSTLRISVRGSDGTTRTATVALT